VAESTREALRKHIDQWRSKGQPGFNSNPINELEESLRWLCERIDEPSAEEGKAARG
jgi:hypothetical protein